MLFGAIGDDFTGSSDLGLMLADGGMRTVQYVGTPNVPASLDVDAGIVALKTRSAPVREAIEKSIQAYRWLKAQGCQQFMFKYCSTFDSTASGNNGQVIDALVNEIGTDKPVVVCPVFPGAGRSIYQGHLFVNDTLLSESGMQNHPLTPMTDPDIRRVLVPQTTHKVGHLPLADILSGNARSRLIHEANHGRQLVVCDAVSEDNLYEIAKAASDFPLITGGSGIALGIPANFGKTSANKADWCKKHKTRFVFVWIVFYRNESADKNAWRCRWGIVKTRCRCCDFSTCRCKASAKMGARAGNIAADIFIRRSRTSQSRSKKIWFEDRCICI